MSLLILLTADVNNLLSVPWYLYLMAVLIDGGGTLYIKEVRVRNIS